MDLPMRRPLLFRLATFLGRFEAGVLGGESLVDGATDE
jgi:hypothetical protein